MQQPSMHHWSAVKRVLRYLKGTCTYGILIRKSTSLNLHTFVDADWVVDVNDHTSTSAYLIFLGDTPISWSSETQRTIARSSTEAEYRSVASFATKINWIQNLLLELRFSPHIVPTIYCDNVGATYLCANPVFHSRMKHIAIDFHFIRDQIAKNQLRVSHIYTIDQLVDSLTKPLSRQPFLRHQYKIDVRCGTLILRGPGNRIISTETALSLAPTIISTKTELSQVSNIISTESRFILTSLNLK